MSCTVLLAVPAIDVLLLPQSHVVTRPGADAAKQGATEFRITGTKQLHSRPPEGHFPFRN